MRGIIRTVISYYILLILSVEKKKKKKLAFLKCYLSKPIGSEEDPHWFK